MHAQRFLWWDENSKPDKPSVYVMRALTFGIRCAPCIAHYVRNKNADAFAEKFPRAADAIKHHHYVDDLIDSENSEHAALQLAKEVKSIHASGGFHIRNWASNSVAVVEQLQSSQCSNQAPKQLGTDEKVLGLTWDPNADVFKYTLRFARLKRDALNDNITPTKREVLQVLMSVFDPLGFVSNYTIMLKILLQDVWRSKIDWDEELPDDLNKKWSRWKSTLPLIAKVQVPRCYSQLLSSADDVQLHTFTDASEQGYAAVCYLRVQSGSDVDVSIVAAKSKVAPLKPVSIHRLELQAALLGVRLAQQILKIPRLRIRRHLFWTDSATVLKWLRMDPRQFQQFVMFRVAEILEKTNVDQWNWVPTRANPADLATKADSKVMQDTWLQGPIFLRGNENDWPQRNDFGPLDKSEIRHHLLYINSTAEEALNINVQYFSSWKRLYRAVATFMLYLAKLKAKVHQLQTPKKVTNEMIQLAKKAIIKSAQISECRAEISCIKHGKAIQKSSKLISLNIILDNDGLMRVKSRAESLAVEDVILLPNHHNVTHLIVKEMHEKNHHVSHETTINQIRGKYFIPRLRMLYRTVRRECQWCKIKNATPVVPQMAPLPAARLAYFERPFTYVGIDFFGPLFVTVGRRTEKRWGVIFTCLTIRAVHIEVAHSLDTGSCILCIRNFTSRRGMPKEIYTDNGTNFKATAKVLEDEASIVNHDELEQKFDEMKWRFNPPSAPHMGGAWERLIRSIKTVLNALKPQSPFNDETLRSALCEVEFIINARPLTFVSVDPDDDEALTPNHLLIGSSGGQKPIGVTGNFRQRFRQSQMYVDRFWERWIKEYGPTLTRRTKWFAKQPPLKVGDIVVIVDENQPRNHWPKGVVVTVVTARDGQVRRATVRTKTGFLERPTAKLAILDVGKE